MKAYIAIVGQAHQHHADFYFMVSSFHDIVGLRSYREFVKGSTVSFRVIVIRGFSGGFSYREIFPLNLFHCILFDFILFDMGCILLRKIGLFWFI